MERPALFVGDAEGEETTLDETEVRERMEQGLAPESAEEYLLRVRIESHDLPDVVEAHVPEEVKKKQTFYMPSTEPVSTCPAILLPTEEWEREVLSTFVELRQYLRRWKATSLGNPVGESSGNGSNPAGMTSSSMASNSARGKSAFKSNNTAFDPTNDDDAQSTFCVAPVESMSRFDTFSATLAKPAENDQSPGETADQSDKGEADPSTNQIEEGNEEEQEREQEQQVEGDENKEEGTGAPGEEPGAAAAAAAGEGVVAATSETSQRPYGNDWLRTNPRGTAPSLRLAIQFDQVLTQKVLTFHAGWLKNNLLSRARAVWIYTLLACLEKPLGSETAALVRELLRRCCAQRAELESPLDENLPALNVIAVIAGTFFQQAETN